MNKLMPVSVIRECLELVIEDSFKARVENRQGDVKRLNKLRTELESVLAAPEPAAPSRDEVLVILPKIIGPCSEIVERVMEQTPDFEGCETDQEVIAGVLNALKISIPGKTAEQPMDDQKRDEILEEAAKVCENTPVFADMQMEARRAATKDCATNIRALKSKTAASASAAALDGVTVERRVGVAERRSDPASWLRETINPIDRRISETAATQTIQPGHELDRRPNGDKEPPVTVEDSTVKSALTAATVLSKLPLSVIRLRAHIRAISEHKNLLADADCMEEAALCIIDQQTALDKALADVQTAFEASDKDAKETAYWKERAERAEAKREEAERRAATDREDAERYRYVKTQSNAPKWTGAYRGSELDKAIDAVRGNGEVMTHAPIDKLEKSATARMADGVAAIPSADEMTAKEQSVAATNRQADLKRYQEAELPDANHDELVKHMQEESFDCPLCLQAAVYLEALRAYAARMKVERDEALAKLKPVSEEQLLAIVHKWHERSSDDCLDTLEQACREVLRLAGVEKP